MQRYHALSASRGRQIPYTNVRGASDIAVPPAAYNATSGEWSVASDPLTAFDDGYKRVCVCVCVRACVRSCDGL